MEDGKKKKAAKRAAARRRAKKRKKVARPKLITRSTLLSQYCWTPKLIEKYLPEPIKKKNPHYATSAPMLLWEESVVLEAMQREPARTELEKIRRRREKKAEKERKERDEIRGVLLRSDYRQLLERAKGLDRRFVLHCGPTNSGKTYDALQALRRAKSGVYLGPLRLLALEVFDTLNRDGVYCSLLTGEEKEICPSAGITASTIEMLDTSVRYDVAVIDEAQLIADPTRGGAWTKALLCVNAAEVHLCFAPEVLDFLLSLLAELGAPVEVHRHERLTPLRFAGNVSSLACAQQGDAFIGFSRRSVLNIAARLEKDCGLKASVIYGALPPGARREEVRKFEKGETSVVVATDAIGMGISLPIRRVIFCETMKFDGTSRRSLFPDEIKQIAGRAGRFGKFECGEVLVLGKSDIVEQGLSVPSENVRYLTIPFPREAISSGYPLAQMLSVWQELPHTGVIKYEDMSEPLRLLECLKNFASKMDAEQVFDCICCPVDTRNERLVAYWLECCASYSRGERPPRPFEGINTLENCETRSKQLDIYHQMMRRCGIEVDTSRERAFLCRQINELLSGQKERYIQKCRFCGKVLPIGAASSICEECGQRRFEYDALW